MAAAVSVSADEGGRDGGGRDAILQGLALVQLLGWLQGQLQILVQLQVLVLLQRRVLPLLQQQVVVSLISLPPWSFPILEYWDSTANTTVEAANLKTRTQRVSLTLQGLRTFNRLEDLEERGAHREPFTGGSGSAAASAFHWTS